MKAKKLTVDFTTGKKTTIDLVDGGFAIVDGKVIPLSDWDMNTAFKAIGALAATTMGAQVDNYGSFRPLFNKLEETVSGVERQLSKETWSKEFAFKYQQGFLIDEIMQDSKLPEDKRKYKELFDKMIEYTKLATDKLNDSKSV